MYSIKVYEETQVVFPNNNVQFCLIIQKFRILYSLGFIIWPWLYYFVEYNQSKKYEDISKVKLLFAFNSCFFPFPTPFYDTFNCSDFQEVIVACSKFRWTFFGVITLLSKIFSAVCRSLYFITLWLEYEKKYFCFFILHL